ncbi:MAG TPA: DUF4912 domain-containing protein [Thermosynechococcaceae cyanobacterium]
MVTSKERPPLEDMTLRQLRRVASEYGVFRYSRMRKEQLLASIREIQQKQGQLKSFPTSIPVPRVEAQAEVEAAKFDVGQDDRLADSLAAVDEGLADLPAGYGESRIVLMPRDPQWAYTYWDIPVAHKEELRQQGGQQLSLRIYDVTDVDLSHQRPHSLQEYPCDELAREWYLPIPVSDREYMIDIGYRTADGRWLVLARSAPVRVPPVYPSDWIDDQFISVAWEEDLRDKTFLEPVPPTRRQSVSVGGVNNYSQVFEMAGAIEARRVAGSISESDQHVPGSVYGSHQLASGSGMGMSSYVLASGMGMWASGLTGVPTMSGAGLTMSGAGMSGVGMMESGVGMMGMSGFGFMGMSGIGMSGVGMMSGAGFSASALPIRPRQFWLVADAELIVYGATEPDATVTIGGRPIQLNPDGTFRFQVSFQDGVIDYPILAVAADGEQNRAVHMTFTRETPERRTNTKEEAVQEWLF